MLFRSNDTATTEIYTRLYTLSLHDALPLSTGRQVSVRPHYRLNDARGAFLKRVRDGACRWFHGTLGPDYNTAHADHFHLDHGPYRLCR